MFFSRPHPPTHPYGLGIYRHPIFKFTGSAEVLMACEGGGMWRCLSCHLVRKKQDLRRHIEAKHLHDTAVNCSSCHRPFKNSDSLRHHRVTCGGTVYQ